MPADPPPALPGPPVAAGPATMLELGAALGADVWWLEQVFEVAGDWVPDTPEAAVRIHLAELSRVAGEHAVALRGHLPRPAPVDPDRWVVPPWPAGPTLVAGLAGAATTSARLAGLHRVLIGRLVAEWTRPLAPSARGPARAIGHARSDLAALREEGALLLDALLVADPAAVAVVAEITRDLEEVVVGGAGLRPPPPPDVPA